MGFFSCFSQCIDVGPATSMRQVSAGRTGRRIGCIAHGQGLRSKAFPIAGIRLAAGTRIAIA
jgi:3-hydroxy-3-methylglutaryl CoA synthase